MSGGSMMGGVFKAFYDGVMMSKEDSESIQRKKKVFLYFGFVYAKWIKWYGRLSCPVYDYRIAPERPRS
jgi:hypothetical protein